MSPSNSEIEVAVRAHQPEMVSIRRSLHRMPEQGYKEHRTAELIRSTLGKAGLSPLGGALPTSVTARIGLGTPTIALRADMDALTLAEENDVEYCSEIPGMMHGCGHDGHVAMLLGATMALRDLCRDLPGSVLLVFQPAEESPKSGAQPLIDGGVLGDPPVDEIFALHLWPELPMGVLGVRNGPILGSSDGLRIVIHGKGGHCAEPHKCVDALVVAAHVIVALQSVVARCIDPIQPAVLHIGTIAGGSRRSVVASRVEMSGTVRTLDETVRARVLEEARRVAIHVAGGFGATIEWENEPTQPVTVNHELCVQRLRRVAPSSVIMSSPVLIAEDFGRYLQRVPGAIGLLGCGGEGETRGLHSPRFDFDEEVLSRGAEILVRLVLDFFGMLT